MKKIIQKISFFLTALTVFLSVNASQVLAQGGIVNPATGVLGGNEDGGVESAQSGNIFIGYMVILWNSIIAVGALLVLFYFILGAIDWITSTGDKAKLEGARSKMLNAFIGLLLLVSSYTIIGFVGSLFFGTEFDILRPRIILLNQ